MHTQPAFKVIGIETRTSNFKAMFDLPKLWKRFRGDRLLEQIPGRIDEETIAVYTDYEGDHTKPYTLLIGARVDSLENIPEGMVGREIPEQTYEVHPVKGELPMAVLSTWQGIWKSDAPRAYKADFEVYGPEKAEIWIGLDSK